MAERSSHIFVITTFYIDLNKAADARRVVVVTGTSNTVGAAGGWLLGGGHSSLSRFFGLGVDSK